MQVNFRGLSIEGNSGYCPPTMGNAACGGDPPSWDPTIEDWDIEDWDEFIAWGLLDYYSMGLERMLKAAWDRTGSIPSTLRDIIMGAWEDAMLEALCE